MPSVPSFDHHHHMVVFRAGCNSQRLAVVPRRCHLRRLQVMLWLLAGAAAPFPVTSNFIACNQRRTLAHERRSAAAGRQAGLTE